MSKSDLSKDALQFVDVCLKAARKNPTQEAFIKDRFAVLNGSSFVVKLLSRMCVAGALYGSYGAVVNDEWTKGSALVVGAIAVRRYVMVDFNKTSQASKLVIDTVKQHGMPTTIKFLKASRKGVPPSQLTA